MYKILTDVMLTQTTHTLPLDFRVRYQNLRLQKIPSPQITPKNEDIAGPELVNGSKEIV